MKTKALKQRLFLKKQTISNLNNAEMRVVKGGTEDSSACISIKVCSVPIIPSCYVCPITINHGCPDTD